MLRRIPKFADPLDARARGRSLHGSWNTCTDLGWVSGTRDPESNSGIMVLGPGSGTWV